MKDEVPRLLEALALRIKDVDFARGQLTVRDPKWKHDRTAMLPAAVTAGLHEQIVHSRLVHQEDLACGWGETWLPNAIARKFPDAPRDPRWHWVFPATRRWRDKDGREGRHHLHVGSRAARRERRRACVRHGQTRHLPHLPPLVRDASTRSAATTSAPFRNCSDIATSRRP